MNKIGLLIIATNKYVDFLQPLITSADKFFLIDQEVEYFVFTNTEIDIHSNRKINRIAIEHKPWPWMTLGRYEIFNAHNNQLKGMDYLYYTDVDMLFVNHVGAEILGKRVATQHPGYYNTRGTPEYRPESLACVFPFEEMQYFAGGFNGGSSIEYLKMAEILSNNINQDFNNGIIAIWHDESHTNRYFIDNPPTVILNPDYCHPSSLEIKENTKILALVKDHNKYR